MHGDESGEHPDGGVKVVPNGGDAAVSALRDGGVTTVFGIPASYTVEIYDAILRQGGIRSIVARNEQAAAFMADGYARRSGRPGVAVVTGGPGLGNTVTGLQTAYADSSSLMVIASDHDPGRRREHPLGLPHEAYDQAALARATGAGVIRADDGGSITGAVEETLAACSSGRPRPGVVLISRAALEARRTHRAGKRAVPVREVPGVADAELGEAARLLRAATGPVVLAGAGVSHGHAEARLASFLRATGLRVVTTVPGCSSVERNGNWAGVLDTDAAREIVEGADLVLALGTGFGCAATAGHELAIKGSLIYVGTDPSAAGRRYRPTIAIKAALGSFLTSLTDLISGADPNPGSRPEAVRMDKVSHPWTDPIDRVLPSRRVTICGDVTMALRWIPSGVVLGPDRRLMAPWNFMTLGWAYAAALGVQAAAPEDTVLAVSGDGGALFALGELATAVENDLPVCHLVYNNRSYGIIAEVQDTFCEGRRFGVDLEQPDFVAAARSFGMEASRVDTPEGLETALRKHAGNGRPSLIEARVDIGDLGGDSLESFRAS